MRLLVKMRCFLGLLLCACIAFGLSGGKQFFTIFLHYFLHYCTSRLNIKTANCVPAARKVVVSANNYNDDNDDHGDDNHDLVVVVVVVVVVVDMWLTQRA